LATELVNGNFVGTLAQRCIEVVTMIRSVPVAIAAMLMAAATGCTSGVASLPARTTGPRPADGVDVARLDPGKYPTRPLPPLGAAGTALRGGLIESQRMADNVVVPLQVDPMLDKPNPFATLPVKGPDASGLLFPPAIRDAVQAHHYLAGFASGRVSTRAPRKSLINVVLRFATPDDAAAAAADMAARSASLKTAHGDPTPTHPVPIPRYPATAAVAYDRNPEVLAYTARGPYVLAQRAIVPGSTDGSAGLVAATLDLQQPLIDEFVPTPLDQLPNLPVDPDGLLARTIARPADQGNVTDGGYGPHGALHYQIDAGAAQSAFTGAGMKEWATSQTGVYETANADGALRVRDALATSEGVIDYQPATGIDAMPPAKCFVQGNNPQWKVLPKFYCVAVADRYVIESASNQEPDAHQALAAQYLMLLAPR
jgi:hypothetical protein